jgi:hypothetical protein
MPLLDQDTISTISRNTKIETIAELVKSGKCILFMGAGVHFPSPDGSPYNYTKAECPPLGSQFSEQLAGKCDFSKHFPRADVTNLQRVSLCYETVYGRSELVKEIKNAVQVNKQPSPALRALARLPFSLIITTNYDQLFERALREAGKEPVIGIYNKESGLTTFDYLNATAEEPFVFKLHGDITQEAESIVITDEDYIQFVLRMTDKDNFHPVPETFRYYFKKWATLFVGYSLLDYNLRLLFKTLRWQMDKAHFPITYSVDPYPDPLIFDVWQNMNKYVTFIARDVWTFVPELYRDVTGEEMPL